MDKVVICHACGRTMESAFRYCPWCGDQIGRGDRIETAALGELVESVFSQVSVMQTTHARTRISRMQDELGELEKELSLLIAGEHIS